ncbi:MAG: DUF413 domain-containing protein [Bacteroidia bacterium]|nr:DUF413 domain-containing protein [Bacteroidia bacterium]
MSNFSEQDNELLAKKLLSGFLHQPTSNQLQVAKLFAQFLHNPNNVSIFILRGYAGTGKTTLITHFIKYISRSGTKCILMAPTGKAAKVLAEKAKRTAYTIHRYLYHATVSSNGYYQFKLRKNQESQSTIFWIDEASMVSDISQAGGENILKDLLRYVQNPENKELKFKIVFVGDPAQLPPIGQENSPALDDTYLLKHFGYPVYSFTMTDIKRQHLESGILYNATRIRQYLTQPTLPELQEIYINQSKPDIFIANSNLEFIQEFQANFLIERPDAAGLFTFSNQAALKLNQYIRSLLFYEPEEIQEGDLLMVVKNNYHVLSKNIPQFSNEYIANGETCVVTRIYRETTEEYFGSKWVLADLRFEDIRGESVEVNTYILLDLLHSAEPNLSAAQTQAIYTGFKHLKKEKTEYDYLLQALQVKFGYAVTGHKAQGGQWEKAFVYFEPIYPGVSVSNYLRWCYTVITRAEKQLFLFNCPFTIEPENVICYRQNFSWRKDILNQQHFLPEEFEFLNQYGSSIISLLNGSLPANTDNRKHLIQVINADAEPESIPEKAALKYVQLFEISDLN